MSKGKVIHLIDSGGFFGAEQMLIDLIIAQRSLGLDAVLGSIALPNESPKAIEQKAQALGLPWVRFELVNRPSLASTRQLVTYITQQQFQLAHSHGYKASILLALYPRFLRKFPVIATVHGATSQKLNKMYLYQLVDKLAQKLLQGRISVFGHYWLKRGLCGYQGSIPNGLGEPVSDWQPEPELQVYLSKYKVIGSVGRLSPEKGFDLLIDAFNQVQKKDPELRLVLMGSGRLKQCLQAQIERLGLSQKVWLTGYKNNAAAYIPAFHLFVNSSYTEGLPMTLLEAMRASVPIVASKVGGIPALLNHGKLGTLVVAGNVQELADGIEKGLAEPSVLLAQHANQEFESEYRSEIMAQRYIDLYERLLS